MKGKPRPDGSVHNIEIIKLPIIGKNGETVLLCSIVRNITEQKRADRKLANALAEFSAVMETIDYGVVLLDRDLKARIVNRAFQDMWGIPDAFLAENPALAEFMNFNRHNGIYDVPDEEFDAYVEQRVAAVGKGAIQPMELERADGKIFRYQCIALADGGRMLTYFDITDRKRMEKSLRESEASLKTQVAELMDREERLEAQGAELVALAEDTAAVRDELDILNKQKDKFFSIIAHDLRSPFHSLLGYSEILATRGASLSKEQVAEYAKTVHQASERAFALVEDLLDWSRLQMGRMDFDPEPFDLGEAIGDSLLLFEQPAAAKGIRLRGINGTDETQITVSADKHMVDTILRNLINNAIKFTDTAGKISVTARTAGDKVEVAVADNGIGMTPEKLARLFHIEENESTKGTQGEVGTGLGLHLCKELVEKHGGEISGESAVNEGSTFRFTLPAKS